MLRLFAGTLSIFSFFFTPNIYAEEATSIIHIQQTEYLMTNVETPDEIGSQSSWKEIALPDAWRVNHPGYSGDIWYRFQLDFKKVPETLWAIYLPRVSMNAAVYVNGKMIGCGGTFSEPIARNWNRPLFFTLSQNIFHEGENTLLIRVKTEKMDIGRLLPFHIGQADLLQPLYESTFWNQVSILQFFFLISFIASLFTFWFWLKHRNQPVYGWYALGTLSWAIFISYFFVRDIPLHDARLWVWLTFSSCFWMIASMMLFTRQLLDTKHLQIPKWVIGYTSLATLILLFTPPPQLFTMIAALLAPYTLIVGSTIYLLISHTIKTRSNELILLGIGVFINVIFGLHDLAALALKWTPPNYKLQYGVPVMLFVMAVILVRRYSQTIHRAEKLSLKVEHAEIYRQQTLFQEREKIMRDIHDGIGGNLLSALSMSEMGGKKNELVDVLRHSLDDLRVIIDSLDPAENDLFMMLAMFRHRYATRLEHHSITMNWEVEELDQLKVLNPNDALQVLRIMQEAITNIIKHANATAITLRTYHHETESGAVHAVIEVVDNGKGFVIDAVNHGKGMNSMQHRANKIGAKLRINQRDDSSGVRLQLMLPTSA